MKNAVDNPGKVIGEEAAYTDFNSWSCCVSGTVGRLGSVSVLAVCYLVLSQSYSAALAAVCRHFLCSHPHFEFVSGTR